MSAPWIEAWKAWLARGAEMFRPPAAPQSGKPKRVAPPAPEAPPHAPPNGRKAAPHRSGKRHG
jgi:hypothetical protein